MDFTISPRIEDFRRRIARFVQDELLPVEEDRANYDPHENIRLDLLEALRDKGKAATPSRYVRTAVRTFFSAARREPATRSPPSCWARS